MKQYLNLIQKIFKEGSHRTDRTGVGTVSLFGENLRFDLSQGFPAVTTKKLAFKAVKSELLWFLSGSTSERDLARIHHMTKDPHPSQRTIWTDNAESYANRCTENMLGPVYGSQWRAWKGKDGKTHDQIRQLVQSLKENPTSRRHIVNAWNVSDLDDMALPPCHVMSQFYVSDDKLSCMMTQRSCDAFLGLPFNIASYAMLTHMLAQVTGYQVGELIINLGDVHLYKNHLDQAMEQLKREPLDLPQLWLNPEIDNIDDFGMDDIKLENYQSHGKLYGKMAV